MAIHASINGPDPIDVAVGLALRTTRKTKGMSQSELGHKLGITFQQIQKYERGTNRISASMLVKAAEAVGVAPDALLPEGGAAVGAAASLATLTNVRGADDLLKAYASIRDPKMRRAMLQLARTLAVTSDVEGEA